MCLPAVAIPFPHSSKMRKTAMVTARGTLVSSPNFPDFWAKCRASDRLRKKLQNYAEFFRADYAAKESNRRFPSCLLPLFQNESKCETFHMKMSFTHKSIRMQIILIFI